MVYVLTILVGAALLAGLVRLNLWHRRYLASLSDEDRKREEEEARIDMQIW